MYSSTGREERISFARKPFPPPSSSILRGIFLFSEIFLMWFAMTFPKIDESSGAVKKSSPGAGFVLFLV